MTPAFTKAADFFKHFGTYEYHKYYRTLRRARYNFRITETNRFVSIAKNVGFWKNPIALIPARGCVGKSFPK